MFGWNLGSSSCWLEVESFKLSGGYFGSPVAWQLNNWTPPPKGGGMSLTLFLFQRVIFRFPEVKEEGIIPFHSAPHQNFGAFALTTAPKCNVPFWKIMVGRLLSFWEGLFSGAMLNFRRTKKGKHQNSTHTAPPSHKQRAVNQNLPVRRFAPK